MEGHSLFLFHDYFLAVGNVDTFGGLFNKYPMKVVNRSVIQLIIFFDLYYTCRVVALEWLNEVWQVVALF